MNEAPPVLEPMTPAPTPPSAPAHRDRRTALVLFGSLQLILAVFCVLLSGLVVFGQSMAARSTGAATDLRFVIPAMAVYGGAAIVFVCLGIGSIRCRRWARSLTLVLSWCWLVVGLVSVPMLAWFMPKILASTPGAQPLSSNTITFVVIAQVAFMGVFFILLPAGLLVFYANRQVRATCETRDPVPRWTDACPLPLLVVACVAWGSAVLTIPTAALSLSVIPVFGYLVAGLPGAILMVGLGGLLIWIGRAWYVANIAGWWALLALIVLFAISNAVTFSRLELVELYRAMNYPREQIDLIQRQGWMSKELMLGSCLAWGVPSVAYLLWVRRFFSRSSSCV